MKLPLLPETDQELTQWALENAGVDNFHRKYSQAAFEQYNNFEIIGEYLAWTRRAQERWPDRITAQEREKPKNPRACIMTVSLCGIIIRTYKQQRINFK